MVLASLTHAYRGTAALGAIVALQMPFKANADHKKGEHGPRPAPPSWNKCSG
jgi:hypothetical protein